MFTQSCPSPTSPNALRQVRGCVLLSLSPSGTLAGRSPHPVTHLLESSALGSGGSRQWPKASCMNQFEGPPYVIHLDCPMLSPFFFLTQAAPWPHDLPHPFFFLLLIFKIFILYWCIVGYQCCVSFKCIAK